MRKGQAMGRGKWRLVIILAVFSLAACSYIQPPLALLGPLSKGQARLTAIEMPEYVREGLNYDVILKMESEETPKIEKVCFRWLTEQISSGSPSLNCFAMNIDSKNSDACAWTQSELPHSAQFCVPASDIRSDAPGRLIVRIRPTNLQAGYNRLEAQAEYLYDGQLRVTNAIRTPITVDK